MIADKLLTRMMSVRRGASDPIHRVFNDILAPFESTLPSLVRGTSLTRPTTTAFPIFDVNRVRADVHETDTEYIVEAEVPGVKRDDLTIDLTDGEHTLSITGHQEAVKEDQDDKKTVWFRERMVGEFKRSFYFDEPVLGEQVKAELKDGVLRVTVPKEKPTESKAQARKMEIQEPTTSTEGTSTEGVEKQ